MWLTWPYPCADDALLARVEKGQREKGGRTYEHSDRLPVDRLDAVCFSFISEVFPCRP